MVITSLYYKYFELFLFIASTEQKIAAHFFSPINVGGLIFMNVMIVKYLLKLDKQNRFLKFAKSHFVWHPVGSTSFSIGSSKKRKIDVLFTFF